LEIAKQTTLTANGDPQGRHNDITLDPHLPGQLHGDEQLQYHDIENPLQLLARASDLQRSPGQGSTAYVPTPRSVPEKGMASTAVETNQFFFPLRATIDVDDALKLTKWDPIDIGLITTEEAQTMITFFYNDLAHTRWGLDPSIHSFEFVRNQSAFLLTSMLAASALFVESASALARRLQIHRDQLAHQVISQRLRSVEIVLAFMVNIPWMHPGKHAADDDTALYISCAQSIAIDLSLNKIVTPSALLNPELANRVSAADCIDSKKALAMDGFEAIPVESSWGKRLLCRRERAFLALFVLEHGVCLARGRSYSVPLTPLVRFCDSWLSHEMATPGDGAMLSMTVLRRDLDTLFEAVRARCDSYRVIDVGAKVAQEIESTIEQFYAGWRATWTRTIGDGEENSLPPYVEILVTHTRLSTYGGVINHPTAPLEVKRLFRASTLSSALSVMRAAIQGESKLSSMPNNTVIMICFAACVAMQLSSTPAGTSSQLVPSIFNLVDETAAVLDRIGRITPHRNGSSTIYAQYLRELLQQASSWSQPAEISSNITGSQQFSTNVETSLLDEDPATQHQYAMTSNWMEPLDFSTMSNDQILESVLHAAPDFNTMLPDLDAANSSYMWQNFMNPLDFGF
jgi:hypothetical protein